ncbi:MAG: outer membrane protein assembly factor BamD [Myxococcales bacterium]|nr:MAG: outer membrane protein assembly factor BamD [Myxococcales bacterium]
MTRPPMPSEPAELLRQLAQENLPSPPEDSSAARRERLVRGMREAIDRSAETAEKRRRLRRIVAAVSVAACLSVSVLGGMLLRDRATAPDTVAGLDRVSGTVVLTQDGRGNVVGGAERGLHDGDAVQTAAGARARLQTIKASVDVSESTELRVSRPSAAEERITLRRGRVDVSVEKSIDTQRAVVVETPDAEVVVRGTVFDVRVEPREGATNTHVHVTRGSVWVLSQGVQVALLSAGQSWSSAGEVRSQAPTASAPPPAAASVAAAERAPAVAPPTPAVSASPRPAKPAKAPVRKPGTLAEENRLFSAGVEARNRGDSARAAELFAELLATYPQSTLREVAQVERFRALKSAGQGSRASTEARRYLAEHPEGAARTEARDLALESQK